MDPGDLATEMLAAPTALAYLAVARASRLSAAQAAEPLAALFLSANAVDLTDPWRGDREEIADHLAASRSGLRDYARALSHEPALYDAWFAPVDQAAQVWIEPDGADPPAPARLVSPCASFALSGDWEAYAQKSAGGLYTCTVRQGVHPVLLDDWGRSAGDYHLPDPRPMWHLPVEPGARVLEIRDAGDWHALCAAHPLPAREIPGDQEGSGITTVHWPSVAERWDGVHMTIGGVLLAERRLVERDGLRTLHSGWDVEQTLWLRWVFGQPESFEPALAAEPDLQVPEWS